MSLIYQGMQEITLLKLKSPPDIKHKINIISAYLLSFQGQPAQKVEGFLHFSTNEANGNRYLALEEIFYLLALSTISVSHLQKYMKSVMQKTNNMKFYAVVNGPKFQTWP